ncbi:MULTISPECIES: flagellar biosynthesis protein FlgA [Cohnella]|uniref:flagellar biosynthesis protein FlgA n=1 Tax=Cohnella TaxID=329857 RepID=UPI0009B9BBE0|nr:flagellar biosynthesis protein FlgA [Cohnella massiliensis]MBN2982623.1 flagellar biosynthesis protein FlgA [Cohnella algarum]
MNRRRQIALSLSAALLSGIVVYGVYVLQLRQIQAEETVTVIAPKRFIPAGSTLDVDMLTEISLPRSAVTDSMISHASDVAGMQTHAPLGTEEPILDWKIDRYPLLPGPGEATFQIPREYVISVSNGIRAGDRALVYVSSKDADSRRMFEEPVVVASVKTSANAEIDDPDNSNLMSLAEGDKARMYASRRDANGSIDSVNLNLTEEQWLALDEACKDGNAKLIIAFDASTFGALGEEVLG